MSETITIIIAVVGAILGWTASVAAVIIYLEKRFNSLEVFIRRDMRAMELEIRKSMDKHNEEDDEKFYDHGTRIQRLEIDAFGITRSP